MMKDVINETITRPLSSEWDFFEYPYRQYLPRRELLVNDFKNAH